MPGEPDFIPAPAQATPDFFPAEGAQGAAKPAEPGFLDRDIPLAGHWYNPTLSGVQSIGRGFRAIGQGVADTLDPHVHPGEEGFEVPNVPGVVARPIARVLRGAGETAAQVPEIPGAIRDINVSHDPLAHYAKAAQDTAGEGAAQAVTAAATEGVVRGVRAIPRNVSTAPVRLTARMAEAAANQKLVPVKPILKIMTPADEAGALHLKVPGRDLGLEPKPVFPGANLPEHPGTFPGAPYPEHPGLFPGANLPETPAPEQLNPSLISKARTLPGQIGKEVIRPKIEPAQPIPPRQGLALPAPRMAAPPPASSLIARPQLHPTVTENPAVGNVARAMQKSGVPMTERPSFVLKGSGRINRILGLDEDLTDIMSKSVRQARRSKLPKD